MSKSLSVFSITPPHPNAVPFPRLTSAPSIEAVIHWQAHGRKTLEPESLKEELTQRLPDYPFCQIQQEIEISATGTADRATEVFHWTQWEGFRLQDRENRHVVQFTPNGVVFSRLDPS
jgi:uncharacterized protein (TIGR04255 family)